MGKVFLFLFLWVLGILVVWLLIRASIIFFRGFREGIRISRIESFRITDNQVRYILGIGDSVYMENSSRGLFLKVRICDGSLIMQSVISGKEYMQKFVDYDNAISVISSLRNAYGVVFYRVQALEKLRNGGFEMFNAE